MVKLPFRNDMSERFPRAQAADGIALSRQLPRWPGSLIKSQIGTIVQSCG
jgi:hypothetical protein